MAKKRANGEGNIRKRADGRWEGRYTAGYHPETGKRIIKNVLGKTQAECKAKLSAAMEATRGIDVSRADEYTVATWLRSWYEIYAKPNIRISTANRYQLMVEQYTIPRIGSIKLTKLTAHDLQKLYKDLMENGRIDRKSGHGNPGLSSTTVRSLHLMLHSALERAVKERLILRNPTEDCIAPKVQKIEMQILPPEHIKDYLDAADRRGLLPMFYLELVTGLRKGEITALLWSDLDIQNKTISVSKQYVKNPNGELTLSRPKTETSVRKVSIPQEAVDLLIAEHGKHPENPYMFPSPATGEMYYPDSIVNLHKKILKDAGLPHIRFHDLRHTFATLALQNGVDVKTVSSIGDMLNYLDGYPISLPARYANRVACYEEVYIISNIDLREQYPNVKTTEPATWKAFLRRIHKVIEYKADGSTINYGNATDYIFPPTPDWVTEMENSKQDFLPL